MEHGLEYITFYIQNHIAPLAVCSGPPLVRDKPLGAPAFVRLANCHSFATHRSFVKERYCGTFTLGTVFFLICI